MRPAYTVDPITNALFICTAVVWVLVELRQALRRRSNAASSDRYSLMLLRICIAAGVALAIFALRLPVTSPGYTRVMVMIGLALIWCGIALRWWSFWTLGQFFTFAVMTSADQPVITTGPYRLLRHPSYAGIALALAGTGLAFGNWLSLIVLLVVPLIGLAYRIRVEESALSAALGSAYTSYAATRKRLVPFVW